MEATLEMTWVLRWLDNDFKLAIITMLSKERNPLILGKNIETLNGESENIF